MVMMASALVAAFASLLFWFAKVGGAPVGYTDGGGGGARGRRRQANALDTETQTVGGRGRSPLAQGLPDCTAPGSFKRIRRTTSAKAIVCPMIRDEEGFLAEWVAYYQMHGFAHVMLFDDRSVDNGLAELQPWIASGFVSVRTNWTAESLKVRGRQGRVVGPLLAHLAFPNP